MGMAASPPLHPDLAPLAFLLGSWRGTGHGQYPTIADFSYQETVTYTHVGKPFIVYTQRTQDPQTGAPMHTESGYLRPVGPTDAEMVLSQPSGIVEVHHVAIDGPSVEMVSTTVVCTPTAKPVTAVRRIVTVDGPVMRYTMDMAAMGLELQFHLSAELSWG
jgi:hypothetical protein